MGVTRTGRFAALTNFRSVETAPANARSRGELPLAFLDGTQGTRDLLAQIESTHASYAGFGLLFGEVGRQLHYCSNRGNGNRFLARTIDAGIHGLSNHLLDTPWPKLAGGKRDLERLLRKKPDHNSILHLLADTTTPPDADLPAGDIGIQLERKLASRFITHPDMGYGTRSSSSVIVTRNGWISVAERAFDADARPLPLVVHRFRRQQNHG